MTVSKKLISKKISGMLILEVNKANPNGSPDDGRPRNFYKEDGGNYGLITPMCYKRKFRDVLSDHSSETFLELAKRMSLDESEFHIFESKTRGWNELSPTEAAKKARELSQTDPDAFLSRYWDVRVMGTTLLEAKNDKNSDKKKKDRFLKTGPFTIAGGVSVDKIEITENTISKLAPNEEGDDAREQSLAPAAYKFVQYGLYVAAFEINPHNARHTQITDKDVQVLAATLKWGHLLDTATARPAGSIRPLHIWWKQHENALGSFDTYKFWNGLQPKKIGDGPSVSLNNYDIPDGKAFGAIDLTQISTEELPCN